MTANTMDWITYDENRRLLEERIRQLQERRKELESAAEEAALAGESWMSLHELEAMAPQHMENLRQVLRALSRSRESLRALRAARARAMAAKTREVPGQLTLDQAA